MKWRHLIGAAGGAASIVVCGGKVIQEPPGHAAPDGAFLGADGGLVIEPASGCNGFDAGSFDSGLGAACQSTGDCHTWAPTVVPSGFPISALCHDGSCLLGGDTPPYFIYCNLGTDGDAFCAAYYSQFVLGDGVAEATCEQTSNGSICARLACNGVSDIYLDSMCVVRGDASADEIACKPVN